MKKVIKLMAIMCFTVTALKAQTDFSTTWLNPQFKPGNILQNFNKPLNTYAAGVRSGNQPHQLIPIYDSTYYWQWNAGTNTWNYSNKVVDIIYNPANLVAGSLNEDHSVNGWKNESQLAVTYNSNNLITTELTQSWSGTEWVNYTQTINTYNSNNLETSSVLQVWTGSEWINRFQQIPTYNSGNIETSDLEQIWNGSTWGNYSQTFYTCNSFNDITNYLYQTWNDTAWVNASQTINTRDSYNKLVNSLSLIWNGNAWVNGSQTISINYNTQNEVAGFTAQTWNGVAWVNHGYISNTYDANNIITAFTVKNFNSDGAITSGDSVAYYYSKTASTGVAELNDNSTIKLYPNPTNNIIHAVITLKQATHLQVRLINIKGQTVWSADAGNTANYQNNISVANLPGGVYLFEMITDIGNQSREVVVQK